jgi:hypothetical protein
LLPLVEYGPDDPLLDDRDDLGQNDGEAVAVDGKEVVVEALAGQFFALHCAPRDASLGLEWTLPNGSRISLLPAAGDGSGVQQQQTAKGGQFVRFCLLTTFKFI